MSRSVLVSVFATCVVFAAATLAVAAQDASSSNPYQGVSNPPPDDTITTTEAKPPAAHREIATPVAAAPVQTTVEPTAVVPAQLQTGLVTPDPASPVGVPSANKAQVDGTDDGIVRVESQASGSSADQPVLTNRTTSNVVANDPDSGIVQTQPLGSSELGAGTMIRVKLLDRLSTLDSAQGEVFHSRVASDVLQGGNVLIPVGAEIDGTVVEVSSGHLGGRGSMRLRPETVILADGSRFRLYAEFSGAPGSRTHVGGENAILPDSRLKRDGIEFGGVVGAGATTGAIVGGPVGALTGGLIGAGMVTAHLLFNHPQATLESGTTLLFTLTDRLSLVPSGPTGN